MGGVKPETIAAATAQLLSFIKRPATSPAGPAPPAKRSHLGVGDDILQEIRPADENFEAAGLTVEACLGHDGQPDEDSQEQGARVPEQPIIKEWQPAPDNDLPKGVIDGPDILGADGDDDDFDEAAAMDGSGTGAAPRPPSLVPPGAMQWPGPLSLNSPLGLDAQSLLMALNNMSNPMLLPGDLPTGWPAVTSPLAALGEDGGSAASTPSGSGSPSNQAPFLFFMPQMHLMNPLLMGSLLGSHAAAQQLQANLQLGSAMEDMLKQMPGLQLPANFPKLENLDNWAALSGIMPAKGTVAHGLPAGTTAATKPDPDAPSGTAQHGGGGGPTGSRTSDDNMAGEGPSSSGRRQSDSDHTAAQKQAASIMALRGSLLAYIHEAEDTGGQQQQQQQQPAAPSSSRPLVPPFGPHQPQASFPAGAMGALTTQAAFPAGATGAMPLPPNALSIFPMGAWMQQHQMQAAAGGGGGGSQPKPQQALVPPGALALSHSGSLSLGGGLGHQGHALSPGSLPPGSSLQDLPLPPPIHAEPAVIKSHGGKPKRTVDLEALRLVYDLPINEAAKKLGLGRTVLKKYCRRLNIPRWPYRKLKSMDKLIEVVEEYSRQDPSTSECMQAVLKELRHFRHLIFLDPAIDLEARIKRLRQANFKLEHKLRTMWRQLSNETSNSRRGRGDDDGEVEGDGSD